MILMEQDEGLSKRKNIFLQGIINFHVALPKDVVHYLVSFIMHLPGHPPCLLVPHDISQSRCRDVGVNECYSGVTK